MIGPLLMLALPAWSGSQPVPLDVSTLVPGPPAVVLEVETSKLKGDPRRLSWKPDGAVLYLQTVEGRPPDVKVRHYLVDVAARSLSPAEAEPDWAVQYWTVKQDRVAPGIPSLVIDVQQTVETIKPGTGASGVLDRQSSPDAVAGGSPNPENLANGAHGNQSAEVVTLRLLGQVIAVWVNERAVPGARFSWGPAGSGAMVYIGEHGELVFFDGQKHRQQVPAVKDAFLPAWSADGARLAYLQKTGRRKIAVAWLAVGR